MGLMSLIFGESNCDGAHQIEKAKVLAPTVGQAPTPKEPGSISSIRTIPVCHDPRYFTRQEAQALKNLERKKTSEAKHTKRAYKSLKRIDSADTTVHKAHRSYQKKLAGNELQKIQANENYARRLHGQRKDYAELGVSLQNAETTANSAIASIKEGLLNGK